MQLLTSRQMRDAERRAIENGQASGRILMERAGRGVAEEIDRRWNRGDRGGRAAGDRPDALVLCGPGNNGGDGFVVARLLLERGWSVRVHVFGDPDRMPPDAAANLAAWTELGAVEVSEVAGARPAATVRRGSTVIVDALFGTGLNRPLDRELASHLAELREQAPRVMVAVDLPSGLCSDSGLLMNPLPPFDLTTTFHAPKLGHYLADGPAVCGELHVHPIGLDVPTPGAACIADARTLDLPAAIRKGNRQHKYEHGHMLVVSGPAGKGGAARLAASGGLRIGAGLVTVACPEAAIAENAARLDAVMVRGFRGGAGLGRILADERINALCAGPGLGTCDDARQAVLGLLETGRPLVLDADALGAWAGFPDALFGRLHERVVLTPHHGEFSRLFPDVAARLGSAAAAWPAYSRLDAAREAARRAGCTILLKGADSVISSPCGAAFVHAAAYGRSAPWLATAGSGDVLAGMVAGLLARGFGGCRAAATAAFLHVEAARSFGPGLVAEDIPGALPAVFRRLGA